MKTLARGQQQAKSTVDRHETTVDSRKAGQSSASSRKPARSDSGARAKKGSSPIFYACCSSTGPLAAMRLDDHGSRGRSSRRPPSLPDQQRHANAFAAAYGLHIATAAPPKSVHEHQSEIASGATGDANTLQ